jgi:hypothetical protein
MRKLIFSILTAVYFFAATGWLLTIHYCMGRVDAVHFVTNKETTCSTCGMSKTENNGCCHDENQFIKLVLDQKKPVSLYYTIQQPVASLSVLFQPAYSGTLLAELVTTFHDKESPPRSSPLYVQFRVFRI